MAAMRASCRAACRGGSRPIWQAGNLVEVGWRARLSEQLGNYSRRTARGPRRARPRRCRGAGGPVCRLRPDRCGPARARAASGDIRRLPCLPGRARPSRLAGDLRPAGAGAAAGAGLRPRPREVRGDRRDRGSGLSSRPRPAGPCRAPPPAPTRRSCSSCRRFCPPAACRRMTSRLRKGLDLTGYFLERHVFWPHNKPLPAARARFMETLQR